LVIFLGENQTELKMLTHKKIKIKTPKKNEIKGKLVNSKCSEFLIFENINLPLYSSNYNKNK